MFKEWNSNYRYCKTNKTIKLYRIYDNFPDSVIEEAADEWNTQGILNVVSKYKPKRILVNFKESTAIPRISSAINEIKTQCPNVMIVHAISTSGAAGNNYKTLIDYWHPIIK